jgi:hypothetical protein
MEVLQLQKCDFGGRLGLDLLLPSEMAQTQKLSKD